MLLRWHLEKGSQGSVNLGFEPTEAERRPYAIHQSGKWYTNENIDQMLMERHLNKKARRSSHKNHMKGPRKRTEEDDVRFAQSFEKLVAGFKDIHTGKIEEVMLIKNQADLDAFKKMYGINGEIEKEY